MLLPLLHKPEPLLLKNMGHLNAFYYKNDYLKPRLQKHFPILINSINVNMISISGYLSWNSEDNLICASNWG